MIVVRSTEPNWHSNAYLVADEPGGRAVIVDAGAPVEPLMRAASEHELRVTNILLTHEHHDHTAHVVPLQERYGATLVLPETAMDGITVACGSITWRSIPTPGHCAAHVAWLALVDDRPAAIFTGDTLLRRSVATTIGGGEHGAADLRSSIVDRLLELPAETPVYPGHTDPTTIGDELAHNPFVAAWRGERGIDDHPVQVAGADARMLLRTTRDDGTDTCWIRFADGSEAIVGGALLDA